MITAPSLELLVAGSARVLRLVRKGNKESKKKREQERERERGRQKARELWNCGQQGR